MYHPFQIIMLMSASALMSVAALFYVIRSMPTKPGLPLWAIACLFQSVTYVMSCIFFNESKTIEGEAISYMFQIIGNQVSALGLMLFLGAKVNFKFRLAAFCFVTTCTLFFVFNSQSFLAACVVSFYCAICLIQPAAVIYLQKLEDLHYRITAILLILMSAHLFASLLLKDVDWYPQVGFLIGVILTMSISLGLAFMALMQFKDDTKKSEQRAIQASITDPLTGLYSRGHLDDLFAEYTIDAKGSEGSFAMLYLDLDGFKSVNDTYGHKAGDLILIVVAKRLSEWLGNKGDAVRIGGDELVVLNRLRAKSNPENLRFIAQQILTSLEMPITDGGNVYNISASIGVCSYEPGQSLDQLIQGSDQLMYLAKQAGGKCIFIHNESVGKSTSSTADLHTSRRIVVSEMI